MKHTSLISALFAGIALGCAFCAILITHIDDPAAKTRTQLVDACQRARTRAAVALYKLRVEAPVELQDNGVTQALELTEWMRVCGAGDGRLLLAAAQAQPIDLATIRQQLGEFTQIEAP